MSMIEQNDVETFSEFNLSVEFTSWRLAVSISWTSRHLRRIFSMIQLKKRRNNKDLFTKLSDLQINFIIKPIKLENW